jgi:hypothetical protein
MLQSGRQTVRNKVRIAGKQCLTRDASNAFAREVLSLGLRPVERNGRGPALPIRTRVVEYRVFGAPKGTSRAFLRRSAQPHRYSACARAFASSVSKQRPAPWRAQQRADRLENKPWIERVLNTLGAGRRCRAAQPSIAQCSSFIAGKTPSDDMASLASDPCDDHGFRVRP